MITKKSWKEFRETGLLLFLNNFLFIFGWAIIFEVDDHDSDIVVNVYPARTKFRGFEEDVTNNSYKKIQKFLEENISEIYNESEY